MSSLFWVLLVLLGIAVAARLHSKLRPTPFPAWLTPILESPWRNRERLLDRAGVAVGERLLEVGPGAGWITERAVARVGGAGRVACLDVQPAMLRKVRERLGGRAWLVCASGSELPFRDGAFDRAYLAHVLGEIPDKRGAMAELFRVIRPGGEAAFEEGLPDPDYVRAPVLHRLAEQAGFRIGERSGTWIDYTQRFARP